MKKLGFGFMRLPLLDGNNQTSFDKEQIFKMVDEFIEKGFTYFDTAYMYHDGKSEGMLREALVERYPRDAFILADKLPSMFLEKKEDVERIWNEQLERCGVEFFDYYLLHCLGTENYEKCLKYDAFDFVRDRKKEGKIVKAGFSFHDNAQVLDKILTEHPEMDFVQLQINYLDWEDGGVQSRLCYETAVKHGKEVIVMEPVKGGTLANLPKAAEKLFKDEAPDMSSASWAIRFAASLDNVVMVLSGMSNLSQLRDNMGYMKDFVKLSEKETEIVFEAEKIIRALENIPCTSCRYCMEKCPVGIPIPEYFVCHNGERDGDNSEKYRSISEKSPRPEDCIGCRSCEEMCPQKIKITDQLKRISAFYNR